MMQSGISSGITGDVCGHEGVDEGGLARVQLGEAPEERPDMGRRGGRRPPRPCVRTRGVLQGLPLLGCQVERAGQYPHGLAARGLSLAALKFDDRVDTQASALRQPRLRHVTTATKVFE